MVSGASPCSRISRNGPAESTGVTAGGFATATKPYAMVGPNERVRSAPRQSTTTESPVSPYE
jgi:hypothetical protein